MGIFQRATAAHGWAAPRPPPLTRPPPPAPFPLPLAAQGSSSKPAPATPAASATKSAAPVAKAAPRYCHHSCYSGVECDAAVKAKTELLEMSGVRPTHPYT
jgi:hypothetical protein